MAKRQKIASIVLEGDAGVRRTPDAEHERAVAVHDLLLDNLFAPAGGFDGPFNLRLSMVDNRLDLDVRDARDKPLTRFNLPLTPFRSIIRDYFVVCDSYYEAIKTAMPSRIEAIDVGRRSLHDEGSELLQERLAKNAEIDFQTARRLFTLLCALQYR